MSEVLKPLIGIAASRPLTRDEAVSAFDALFEGQGTPAQMGGFPGGQQQGPRDTVRKVHIVPGQRDGASMFPLANYKEVQPKQWGVMDFQHYHTTAEINYWLERWAKDSNMVLTYRHPMDYTLHSAVAEIRTPSLQEAVSQLNAAFAAQQVSVGVSGDEIVVRVSSGGATTP